MLERTPSCLPPFDSTGHRPAHRWYAPAPLLALGLAALLGACMAPSGSAGDPTISGSSVPPGPQSPNAAWLDANTNSRLFIPAEDVSPDGGGRAITWDTGTPIAEFGDSG